MFAYCGNNPVMLCDPSGKFFFFAFDAQVLPAPPVSPAAPFPTISIPTLPINVPFIGPMPMPTIWNIPTSITTSPSTTSTSSSAARDTAQSTTSNPNRRNPNPPARRVSNNSRKAAKEAAKKAGGGKAPIHHPNGHPGDPRPHYHPNVRYLQRVTPKMSTQHDHYYYPKGKVVFAPIPEISTIPKVEWDMN